MEDKRGEFLGLEMQDYFNIANDYFYKDEFQLAVDNYILGIYAAEPFHVGNLWLVRDAYNKMSQAYYYLGKLDLAIYANNKLLEYDPNSEYGINNKQLFDRLYNELKEAELNKDKE